jgi:predicted house-cleaning NTP pyrophosphatase (Maf/HAM1 superfamily)
MTRIGRQVVANQARLVASSDDLVSEIERLILEKNQTLDDAREALQKLREVREVLQAVYVEIQRWENGNVCSCGLTSCLPYDFRQALVRLEHFCEA